MLLVSLLLRLSDWTSICNVSSDATRVDAAPTRTDSRVLQSYIVLVRARLFVVLLAVFWFANRGESAQLLGCLSRVGELRAQLLRQLPATSDGTSSLIPLARLLEKFLQFQLRNNILTHELYEQATLVASQMRDT